MLHLTIALPLLVGLVVMALAFDFLNGLHDAANSIATVVSTRLLSPVQAVLFAATFNFAAYWIFGLKVAETVGKGIVDKDVITPQVIFGALAGAMAWNVITWWKGIPSSSSHALIGGLLGARDLDRRLDEQSHGDARAGLIDRANAQLAAEAGELLRHTFGVPVVGGDTVALRIDRGLAEKCQADG